MITVRQTDRFRIWFENLRDRLAQKHILVRAGRLERGLFGDVRPVGEGVSELRMSVARDIQTAKQLAADMEP